MKTSTDQHLRAAIIAIAICSGCVATEPTEAPISTEVAVKPTSKPTQKPTAKPTLTKAEKRNAEKKRAKAEARAKAKAAFDVPALIGKKIEQVRATLGPLEDAGLDGEDNGKMSWSNKRGGILVYYDISTRKTTEFFVNEQYGDPLPKDKLLEMGNLQENDPRYTIEFAMSPGDSTKWIGVVVKPND